MNEILNTERLADGRVRAVCEYCDWRSQPIAPDSQGRVDLFDLAPGWSVAWYSPGFTHRDGSAGDLFTCPSCNKRFARGESLRPTDERCAARTLAATVAGAR